LTYKPKHNDTVHPYPTWLRESSQHWVTAEGIMVQHKVRGQHWTPDYRIKMYAHGQWYVRCRSNPDSLLGPYKTAAEAKASVKEHP
jgi:hypothetical protein